MKLIAVSMAFLAVVTFCSSSLAATEDDILRRLDKMEQEIKALKAENEALRETVHKEQVKVDTDRKAITELKRSAGKDDANGMSAVLGNYDMELYGRVKVDINYDTAEFSRYGDFIGVVDAGDSSNDSTNFNPRDSRIGLKVKRRDGVWLSEARIETDFYGDNNGNNLEPRMRLGYIKLSNDDWQSSLLVGQDWIPVASLNPPTIEFGVLANSGNLWWRVPQVTFRKQICNFELLLSAMRHRRLSYEEENRMPWVLAKISYKDGILGKGGLLAIGGGWQTSTIGNSYAGGENLNGNDNDVDRWLAALEFKIIRGKFTFMAEPWIGNGLDREFLRYDMGANYDGDNPNSRPDLILSRGGFAALTYAATSKLKLSVGYGLDDPDADDMKGMESQLLAGTLTQNPNGTFTKSETIFANGWYQVTSAVKMGVEVMYLETERWSDTNNGMRFTFSTCYDF